MQQKKLIFNFFVNRNWKKLTDRLKRAKKLTDSRKRAEILADNRKSHHPIETLLQGLAIETCYSEEFVPHHSSHKITTQT